MCSNSVVELSKLCKFIRIVNSKLCPYSRKKSLKIPKGNHSPYIEEEQTTQWPNEKGQQIGLLALEYEGVRKFTSFKIGKML